MPDNDADLSCLGTFDSEAKSDYAIEHEPDNSRTLNWFNPQETSGDTPRNLKKYAKKNYERIISYERGNWYMIGIKATAEIATGPQAGKGYGLITKVSSSGWWGIESDQEPGDFKEIEDDQKAELVDLLKERGFTDAEINAAPVEFKTL